MIRLTSAILTAVLSSSVVASLSLSPGSTLGHILGILAALASVATVVATNLEGGDARLAKTYADVSVQYSEACSALELARAYHDQADLPLDVEALTTKAAALCNFIRRAILEWQIA